MADRIEIVINKQHHIHTIRKNFNEVQAIGKRMEELEAAHKDTMQRHRDMREHINNLTREYLLEAVIESGKDPEEFEWSNSDCCTKVIGTPKPVETEVKEE